MRWTARAAAAIAGIAIAAASGRAAAQEAPVPPALGVDLRVDGAVVGGALAATGLAALLAVDAGARWPHELLPFDEPAKRRFSASAARASDTLLALSVATPLVLQMGQTFDRAAGERALVLGETVAVSVAANAVTKRLVGRPRPYVYNPDPRVEAYAGREGRDSRLSFYSGHASTAFAAAVAGGTLYALASDDTAARTAVWAGGLALAGATATMRVRAGKHFPSDVLVGALVGGAIGWAVPALHVRGGPTALTLAPSEWIAIAAAPVAGAALAAVVPLPSDISEPLVVPWLSSSGGGLVFARRF